VPGAPHTAPPRLAPAGYRLGMARSTKPAIDPDDAPLKRLGGGRWQTRDERFTIEPQSGTWVVVDAEQTDDLGMALVRGPFPSLTAAKDAISSARSSGPAASPLAERIERRRKEPAREPETKTRPIKRRSTSTTVARPDQAEQDDKPAAGSTPARPAKQSRKGAASSKEPEEPGWLADLDPAERGRARRLIARLEEDGVSDAEGLVRRDVVGDVPALAANSIRRRLDELGNDATPDAVADLLAEGRDERLGVRWRLVDGEGRPIVLDRRPRARR
jgi:hypothetical protein